MNYKALAELFREAPEAPAPQHGAGVAYLLEHVLYPLIETQDVLLENLDLSPLFQRGYQRYKKFF